MPCWKCGHDDPMMSAFKYCTDCGARLIQECMYCHKGIPVQLQECPHCGRALLICRTHYILYDLEQTRCEIPGCGEELVYSGDVFLPYGANLARANSIIVNSRVNRLTCVHANAPISPVIANNTRGYFWKADHSQSKLCCFDFVKGEYVWPDDKCPTADFSVRGDDIINFELSGIYLITCLKDQVLIHLINDGKPVASIPVPDSEYQAWMINKRLYILSLNDSVQSAVYYDPPYSTEDFLRLPMVSVNANEDISVILPAIDDGQAFFVSYEGSLTQLGYNGDPRILFTPRRGSRIGYLAVSDGYVVFSVLIGLSNGESVYELHGMDIRTMEESLIAENIHLACTKLAICGGRIFTCERAVNGDLYFYEYPLTGGYSANPYTCRWRISRSADIYDFYCAVCGNEVYFFYISHSNSFNLIETCCMNGAGTNERLKPMNISSQCGMINVCNHTILTDRNNGQIFTIKTL